MPGLFGGTLQGTGGGAVELEAMAEAFSAAWPGSRTLTSPHAVVGAHAFGHASAVHRCAEGGIFAVDGERSVYSLADTHSARPQPALFRAHEGGITLAHACRGNLAAVDADARFVRLAVETTGSFPLYFCVRDGRMLWSSLLGPLARVVGATPDAPAIFEFLSDAYTFLGRSFFSGIRRLLPGQTLLFELSSGRLCVTEGKSPWAQPEISNQSFPSMVERAEESLDRAVARALPAEDSVALMTSGGWDSRLLLAFLRRHATGDLLSYVHGDLLGRELRLVEQLSKLAGVPLHREPIDATAYDVDALRAGFEKVEHVVFPHWHRAGRVLAQLGVPTVTAGVFGEILGGHYGPSMLLRGLRKALAVGLPLIGRSPTLGRSEPPAILLGRLLLPHGVGRPWYVRPDWWEAQLDFASSVLADVEASTLRLQALGIESPERLVEAMVSTHRGTQYINAQILSCRAALDIAMPYADADLLFLIARLPLSARIHNRLTRAMLMRRAPALLDLPCAATLVPARAPIALQEASRFARVGIQALHRRIAPLRTRREPLRLGWVNFEFLREGDTLDGLLDTLGADLWDMAALRDRVVRAKTGGQDVSMHPLSDQLMKILTVDWMLQGVAEPKREIERGPRLPAPRGTGAARPG